MPVASFLADFSHRSLELWHGGAPELLHEAQAHGLEDRQQTANLRVAPGARISETLSRPATNSTNQLVHTSLVMPAPPRHAARTTRHAARSRSIQETTAGPPKHGVAGFRDWRAE